MSSKSLEKIPDVNSELLLHLKDQVDNDPLTLVVHKLYAKHYTEVKDKFDLLGAEVKQRQDKMRLINEIIAEINQLTDDKNGLDISQNVNLQEKFRVAQELGVKLSLDEMKYTPLKLNRLIENLHLSANGWDIENKNQTQKMEILMKELDRILFLLKEAQKNEERPTRSAAQAIKG